MGRALSSSFGTAPPGIEPKPFPIAAAKLGLILFPLPAYSPDLNPIENLWRWMREEVTHNHCHPSMRHLFDACKAFINRTQCSSRKGRCLVYGLRFELDPEYEKLLVSNPNLHPK